MIRSLPNLISLARLFLAPVILLFIWHRHYERALAWCFIAGISDGLDGYLARRLHAMSRLGGYLDPIGDKFLLSGAYLVLGLNHAIPWWLMAVVLGRDILILGFVAYAMSFTRLRSFRPTIWGKISTAVQILTVLVILFARAGIWSEFPHWIEQSMVTLTIVATGWSAIHYAWVGARMLQAERH